jgi:hypothetical protein
MSSYSSIDDFLKASPKFGLLGLLAFLNWFLCAGINMYFGGDALDTLPSRDGFALISHGHYTAVSESVWLFSLIYSGASLLLTPIIVLSVVGWMSRDKLKKAKSPLKWIISGFIFAWLVLWESHMGGSIYRSINNWSHCKRPGIVLRTT